MLNLNFSKIAIIILILFKSYECLHNHTSKIVFMAPIYSNQVIQLNNRLEFASSKLEKGWYIEANKKQSFVIFLYHQMNNNNSINSTKIDQKSNETLINLKSSQSESHIFYLFFTQNPISCADYLNYTHVPIIVNERSKKIVKIDLSFTLKYERNPYYICLSKSYENLIDHSMNSILFYHQGVNHSLTVTTYNPSLPTSFIILIYTVLVLLNSTFNGLNLGLMSMSVDELEMLIKTSDSSQERQYAQDILPLRKKGNYLLCSILISIALTSSVSILILEDLIEGLFAGMISTLVLCIIGEIIPQAICSRYSLAIGSYTKNFTLFFIYLTSILSYPLSKIVDYILGKEIPTKYNRDAIKELIKKSIGLKEKQCQIISGALDLKSKRVKDIMISLNDVYMIQEDEKLNFENIATIYNSGYSRIPVYKETRNNIVGLFHVKDMTLIDPDDEITVKKLLSIYKHHVAFCYNTDGLADIFEMFRKGSTHLAFVLEIVQNEDSDPYENCIGIVTFHDIIEALLQFDISDEGSEKAFGIDYLKKMIERQKRKSNMDLRKIEDVYSQEDRIKMKIYPKISLQTKYLLLQILTNIKPFKEEFIDKSIIEKLVDNEQNYVRKYIFSASRNESWFDLKHETSNYIYKFNESTESFILILEGSFIVEAGSEKTEFFAKQFDHFGEKALIGDCMNCQGVIENKPIYKQYYPEFSLKIDSNNQYSFNKQNYSSVIYFKIDRTTWLNAVKSTNLKRTKTDHII